MVSMAPNIAKPTRKPMTVAIENVPERKSLSGMIAASPIFDSMTSRATRPTAPMT